MICINKSNCPLSGPSLRFTDTPGFHSPFFVFSSSIFSRPIPSQRLGQTRVSGIRLFFTYASSPPSRVRLYVKQIQKKRYDLIQYASVSALRNSCRKRHKDRVKNEWKWLNVREAEKPEEFSRYTPNFVFNIAIFSQLSGCNDSVKK